MANWQREFPAFPAADIPAIPSSWRDASYANDACPSWAAVCDDSGNWEVIVYVDRADAAAREEGAPRFAVCRADDMQCFYEGDSWQEVLDTVNDFGIDTEADRSRA